MRYGYAAVAHQLHLASSGTAAGRQIGGTRILLWPVPDSEREPEVVFKRADRLLFAVDLKPGHWHYANRWDGDRKFLPEESSGCA